MDPSERLVLGLVPSARLRERDPRTRAFAHALAERTGFYVVERVVSSYEELEQEITLGRIDIAWLPPLLFARLERDAVAVALATRVEERDTYASILVTRAASRVADLPDLRGCVIAWVDPLSASGYVVPRLGLISRRIDPSTTFAHEFFAGSHAEALRAVLGEIPLDLIAARANVPEEIRHAVGLALVEMSSHPELGATVEAVFGCQKLAPGTSSSYEALRDLLARASDPKLGWATESFESTAPPPPNDPTT